METLINYKEYCNNKLFKKKDKKLLTKLTPQIVSNQIKGK